ncbi:protein lifeguard 3 [Drosophila rhopaloa]|uniref:Protein lifeguard 1 n=1 Tax=Drosophila rhopaloa TaxID=1041015 RepID=A0ABM5JBG7_DRORH|nr:protein lifeguard 3 [Drosophila rhopaloa]XP_044316168.1 protein lifeguard 3 [Drosophila rhopaloa]
MSFLSGNRRSSRDEEMLFDDPYTRRIFISKVLMIVAINLLFTVLVMTFCIFHSGARHFLIRHWYIGLIGTAVIFIISIIMCFCIGLFRKSPYKYILLVIYVIAHAALVACCAVRYYPKLVFIAVAVCAGIVILLGLFARFAPCDFTGCCIFLFVLSIVVLIMGILSLFFPILRIVYVALGVLLFSVYIVVDLQMLIGGKTHKNQFDESDFILAAMFLYSDIIFLFIFLLELIGLIDS